MKETALVVLLCLLANGVSAAGWEGTGKEVERLCTGPEHSFDSGACAGYVLAIADIMRDAPKGIGFHGNEACFPADVRVGQLVDAMLRFMKKHAESQRYNAWSLTASAFAEAFPCRRR